MMGISTLLKLRRKDLWALTASCVLGFMIARLIQDPTWAVFASILVSFHLFLAWLVVTGEQKAKLSLPILATIGIHLAFVALVIGLVLARQYIPYFRLIRYAMAALAVFERWLLFSEAIREQKEEALVDLLRPPSANKLPQPGSAMSKAPARVAMSPAQPTPAAAMAQTAAVTNAGLPAGGFVEPQTKFTLPQTTASGPQRMPVMVRDTSISDSIRPKPVPTGGKIAPILNATAEDHEAWLCERATQNPTHRKPGMTVKEEYEQWLLARFRNRGPNAAAR
jgi:hypothetical protein